MTRSNPEADRILADFFSQLAEVREMLWTDIDAAYEGDPAATSFEEIILAYPVARGDRDSAHGPHSLSGEAAAHPAHDDGMGAQPHRDRHSSRARKSAAIFSSITARAWSSARRLEIGSHVKLYQGVTLHRARRFQKDEHGDIRKGGKRHPTVEDHVTIYPNSTVLGGETVVGARQHHRRQTFSSPKACRRIRSFPIEEKEIADRAEAAGARLAAARVDSVPK